MISPVSIATLPGKIGEEIAGHSRKKVPSKFTIFGIRNPLSPPPGYASPETLSTDTHQSKSHYYFPSGTRQISAEAPNADAQS